LAAPATKHEKLPAMRIAFELLLNQQRQPIKPFAHVGVTGCQPYLNPARDRDHRDRSRRATVATATESVAFIADETEKWGK
jgi:hypothetical protein